MNHEKRKTIGVFIDWIESAYHIEFISALEEAAQNFNVNLLTLVGGALNSPQIHEALCNVIYRFINKNNVDGIILASGVLGHYCTKEELLDFCSLMIAKLIIAPQKMLEKIADFLPLLLIIQHNGKSNNKKYVKNQPISIIL